MKRNGHDDLIRVFIGRNEVGKFSVTCQVSGLCIGVKIEIVFLLGCLCRAMLM